MLRWVFKLNDALVIIVDADDDDNENAVVKKRARIIDNTTGDLSRS